MADTKEHTKSKNIIIRAYEKDIKDLEYICKYREMSKSEMILYLIRREADRQRDIENRF